MIRILSMLLFQLKLYAKNQYFFWLMVSSSISMFLTLYLVNYANNYIDDYLWLKAGIFGLWASATTAAGSITFQKHQQTLSYVINQSLDDRLALAIVVLPAIIFGFFSLPLCFLLSKIFGLKTYFNFYQIIIGSTLLIISASIMSLLIATFFVLSRDAIIYEQLINIPIVLLAGVFGFSLKEEWIGKITRWFIPITSPIQILLRGFSNLDMIAFVISTIIWFLIAWYASSSILNISKKTGSLGKI